MTFYALIPLTESFGSGGSIHVPFFGALKAGDLSLPLLTAVLALVDGFNPCAFFVLFFLLSLLIHARSRGRMTVIGGTFIFFSAAFYFLFIAAFLNLFLLAGTLTAVTAAAGAIALLVSLINIKDFFFFRKGVSLTIPDEAKPRLYERMRALVHSPSMLSAVIGSAVLAAAANSYEFLCTAGFPMVFTRALTLRKLPMWEYYAYILAYCAIYVLPLVAILAAFVVTLGSRKLTEEQGRELKLVSGLMMLCLGAALLVRPSLLMDAAVSVLILGVSVGLAVVIIAVSRRFSHAAG